MIFESMQLGSTGRWAFGTIILVYIIAYNETSGPTAIFSAIMAAFYGLFTALCKTEVKHLQIPYIRASNKFDFMCLFLSVWMDMLALLAACGSLARTLSTCLDVMTGGLARILILGRNSPANEPWPDVLGVAVVFLVTGMFMLGLENTKIFSLLMVIGVIGLNCVVGSISWIDGTINEWTNQTYLVPDGVNSLFTAGALGCFAYPGEITKIQNWKFLTGIAMVFLVFISNNLVAACLSMIVYSTIPKEDYIAVPIFTLLEANNLNKLIPAAACLLVLSCSGSFLELFPELYNIIVRLATSEWKILTKQIGYENPDSGSPVLAIFIAGSLCAMLTFACPMQNLIHILAASHLFAGLLRAFYLLYLPFRPKYIQQTNDTTMSYSRLSPASNTTKPNNIKRKVLWSFNSAPIQNAVKRSITKSKNKCGNEIEREWLLLGEPSSPRPNISERHAESTILSDGEHPPSDMEYVGSKTDNSDSDTSTDIDAIVDEYRQKIKVTTAGPMEKTIRVPSITTWRITIIAIAILLGGIIFSTIGVILKNYAFILAGLISTLMMSIVMLFIPQYTGAAAPISSFICTIVLTLGLMLFASCLSQSWPAIVFWFCSGLILLVRCDTWCCLCLDRPITHQLIPSVSAKTTTIRLPRPPRGNIISGRVQSNHR